MMSYWKTFAVVVASIAAGMAHADPMDDSIDLVIAQYGLAGLSPDQQIAARSLVKGIITSGHKDVSLTDSSDAYLVHRGYMVAIMKTLMIDGRNYLVVSTDFGLYATSDFPFSFSPTLFQPGQYYCKSGMAGGCSEIIDRNGAVQDFLLAQWKSLR